MAKVMTDSDGRLMISESANGRRYVACNVQVGHTFCGELIDVTDIDVTADTDIDCGDAGNHRDSHDFRAFGSDAIVP